MTGSGLPRLSGVMITEAVRTALGEDLGRAGDITTAATIPETATARANVVARKAGVLAGRSHATPRSARPKATTTVRDVCLMCPWALARRAAGVPVGASRRSVPR